MSARQLYILVLFLLFGNNAMANGFSWQQEIDSLLAVYNEKAATEEPAESAEMLSLLYAISDLSLRLQRDDVDKYLQQYDTLARQVNNQEALAKSSLLFTRRYLQLSDYPAMMQKARLARTQFTALQRPSGMVRATVRMGQAAEFLNQADTAFSYYFEALDFADTQCNAPYPPDCGVALCMANMYMANLFYEHNMLEEARTFLNQARAVIEDLYAKYPNNNDVAYEYATLLANMATISVQPDHIEQRIDYYNQALALFRQVGYLRSIVVVLHNISALHFSSGDNQQARSYTLEAIEIARKGQDPLLLLQSEIMLARLLKDEGRYTAAHDILQKAEKKALHGNRTRALSRIYAIQAQVDSLNGKYLEALKHKNQFFRYQNQLLNKERGALIRTLSDQVSREKNRKEQALAEKDSAVAESNRIFRIAGTIILILIIISLGVISYLNNRSLKRQRELALQQSRVDKLEHEKLNMELEQKNMKINHKNKELATMASRLIDRSEFLQHLRDYLNAEQLSGDVSVISELNRQLTQQERLTQDLEEFQLYIDEVNQDFFYNLTQTHADLTDNEKRLCALIRMGLSVKEIATINGVTENAIRTGKHRLRRKLDMHDQGNLQEYLAHF